MRVAAGPALLSGWWRSSTAPHGANPGRWSAPRNLSPQQLCLGLVHCHQLAKGRWAAGKRSRKSCRGFSQISCQSKARHVELLVDGDSHSTAEVSHAIRSLQKQGLSVRTRIYAEPRREENSKWRRLFQEPSISFCPIPRNTREANDEQIMADLRHLAACAANAALLTSDRDFVEVVEEIKGRVETYVLIPHRHVNAIETYKKLGVQVLPLSPQREACCPKVRAILHEDGSGSVTIGSPCTFRDYEEEAEAIKPFLQDLGYCQQDRGDLARPFLGHAAAKFWYSHRLGPIEVFPAPCAIKTLHELIHESKVRPTWQQCREKLAYVLPCASRKGRSKATAIRVYGSLRDRQIYQGGGPFLLHDSDDLVARVLRRLGYLDDGLNGSLSEAMLVFVNTNHNKGTLRKLGLLPEASDSVARVARKLQKAFTSTMSPGIWQVLPSDRFLRQLLCKYGFLENREAEPDEVFQAMQRYSETIQLHMESYNGYAFWIMQSLREVNSDPSRTGAVVFDQVEKG